MDPPILKIKYHISALSLNFDLSIETLDLQASKKNLIINNNKGKKENKVDR